MNHSKSKHSEHMVEIKRKAVESLMKKKYKDDKNKITMPPQPSHK